MQHEFFSRRKMLRTGIAGIGALGLSRWSLAAQYPEKPVRVIVPFPPGGSTDVVARLILQKLGERLNQSFILENKSGANGMVGTEYVAHAAPDGYTLLFNTAGAQTLSPVIYKANYEALGSFEPIGMVCDVPVAVIARNNLPANNMQELIALAKNSDKPLSASSGSSIITLMTEKFKRIIGVPGIINVQYKGTSPQMQAVVTGEVDFSFDPFTGIEMIKSGKVKLLGVMLEQRSETFPQIPTLREQGIQDMDFNSWAGMLAPKGTPKAIVDTLTKHLEAIVKDPNVVAKIKSFEFVPKYLSGEQFGKLIQSDHDRWKQIVKETNFKLD